MNQGNNPPKLWFIDPLTPDHVFSIQEPPLGPFGWCWKAFTRHVLSFWTPDSNPLPHFAHGPRSSSAGGPRTATPRCRSACRFVRQDAAVGRSPWTSRTSYVPT